MSYEITFQELVGRMAKELTPEEASGKGLSLYRLEDVMEKAFGKHCIDICNGVETSYDIGGFSDGYHTFDQLYYQRAMLFATIVKQNNDISWKTHRHEDGEPCFGGGWFLVAIDTPEGTYGYHYEDKYWHLFDCPELSRAKHWDGYSEKDVTRLLSIKKEEMGVDEFLEKIDSIGIMHGLILQIQRRPVGCGLMFRFADPDLVNGTESLRYLTNFTDPEKFVDNMEILADDYVKSNWCGE